ncbi:hypothetical protein [Roseateles sp. BYS96W]|uniref:Uncharacterized protein n=1 Tax=Pelomonas nitida TaxID=3299027 RepID=A0ABW7G0R7_9BURK
MDARGGGTGDGPVGRWVTSYGLRCARASYAFAGRRLLRRRRAGVDAEAITTYFWRSLMGKYLLAWLLGVPGIVLVLIYLFFH